MEEEQQQPGSLAAGEEAEPTTINSIPDAGKKEEEEEVKTSIAEDTSLETATEVKTSIGEDTVLEISTEVKTSIAEDTILETATEVKTSIGEDTVLEISTEVKTSIAEDTILETSTETTTVPPEESPAVAVSKLGPKTFNSGVEMFTYFYELLHAWVSNVDVNKYEFMVLSDLLKQGHRDAETKIGAGVKAFQVRFHPGWHSRCYYIIRTDGTVDDFSYRKCVDKIMPLPENLYSASGDLIVEKVIGPDEDKWATKGKRKGGFGDGGGEFHGGKHNKGKRGGRGGGRGGGGRWSR